MLEYEGLHEIMLDSKRLDEKLMSENLDNKHSRLVES